MLYACIENQTKEALISFVLSPSAAKQEEERGECEPQTMVRMTVEVKFGFTQTSLTGNGQPRGICVIIVRRNSGDGVEEQTLGSFEVGKYLRS